MKPPVTTVKVSTKGKDTLIKIKRNTGLEQWNEICRIALCASLANHTSPAPREKLPDSNIEMDWKTFAGHYHDELAALVKYKANIDGIDYDNKEKMNSYFRLHIERGINAISRINLS